MRIRRFTARDMTEALRQVRETLGPEAVILETKKASGRAGRENRVMVVAAVDRHPGSQPDGPPQFGRPSSPVRPAARATGVHPPPAGREPGTATGAHEPHLRLVRTDVGAPAAPQGTLAPQAVAPSQAGPGGDPVLSMDLSREVDRLRGRITYLNRLVASDHFSTIPIPLRELYLSMVEAEVDSNLAFALLRDLARDERPGILSAPSLDGLRSRLLRLIPHEPGVLERPGAHVVLLVGPPSGGKTTVAAGLAARALENGRAPALISADAFRAGGATALESYARILDVPFAPVFSVDDLTGAAARPEMSRCDLLIVDSPGAGRDEEEVHAWIGGLSRALAEPAVHLVIPATAKLTDGADAMARFRETNPSAMVFTKLDETRSYGGMLSLALKGRLPVTYLGCGRSVLTDLRPARPHTLVDLVLERCAIDIRSWQDPRASAAPERAGAARPAVPQSAFPPPAGLGSGHPQKEVLR